MGTIQSVPSMGNPVFLNHCICNWSRSKATLPKFEQRMVVIKPEVPMNWILVKGIVTRTYWRANSETQYCGTILGSKSSRLLICPVLRGGKKRKRCSRKRCDGRQNRPRAFHVRLNTFQIRIHQLFFIFHNTLILGIFRLMSS